jgi:hypothetical protein
VILLLSCAAPEVWPEAVAACDAFSAGCQAVLSEHFGLSETLLTGLPRTGLLEGLWRMSSLDLGADCPSWASTGESGAACLYNEASDAVSRSVYDGEVDYLSLTRRTLRVGDDMGYYSPVRVVVGLADGLAECGGAWVADAGLAGCEGDDCFIFVEVSGETGCP